jgi:hypothetical protein
VKDGAGRKAPPAKAASSADKADLKPTKKAPAKKK